MTSSPCMSLLNTSVTHENIFVTRIKNNLVKSTVLNFTVLYCDILKNYNPIQSMLVENENPNTSN